MSTLSSGRDGSRSETYSDVTESARRARFPSLRLDDPQDFVSPYNSAQPTPVSRFAERRPSEVYAKLTVTERVWYWLCGISRKVWLIACGIFLLALSLVVVGLILIFVLPHNNPGQEQSQVFTTTTAQLSTSVTSAVTSTPYPPIINIGTEVKWFPIGFMESLVPDMRGYTFRERVLAYNSTNAWVIVNSTIWYPLASISQPSDCVGCKLLAATDNCIEGGTCSNREAIFCCQSCGKSEQDCLIHGSSISTSGENIEWRISSDGNQLLLTDSFAFEIESLTAIQVIRANGTVSFQNGPLKIVTIPAHSTKSSLTLDPNFSNVTDLVVWMNSTGFLLLQYEQKTHPIYLGLTGPFLAIDTWLFHNHALIAVLQDSSFEILSFNLQNECVSKMLAPSRYYFDGTFKGSFWAEDKYYLWYNENRGRDGVSLVKYWFGWPDDSNCPYKP